MQLCDIMLRDSAHIQMFEAEWRNRKAKRSNGTLKEFVPLYDAKAVYEVMKQLVGVRYDEIIDIDDNVSVRFKDVGHLLGFGKYRGMGKGRHTAGRSIEEDSIFR